MTQIQRIFIQQPISTLQEMDENSILTFSEPEEIEIENEIPKLSDIDEQTDLEELGKNSNYYSASIWD